LAVRFIRDIPGLERGRTLELVGGLRPSIGVLKHPEHLGRRVAGRVGGYRPSGVTGAPEIQQSLACSPDRGTVEEMTGLSVINQSGGIHAHP
jgi:hypothetical protein